MARWPMRVIELFAGIGGMALALPDGFELVAAFDQDAAAREVHELNHGVPVLPQDLATIDEARLARAGAEGTCWLLSPPCQPFTRRGPRRDVDDPRCRGLLRIIELLPKLRPRALLLENVAGFHGSVAHARLVAALRELGHEVAVAQACPSEEGWPIRRPRQFVVSREGGLRERAPPSGSTRALEELLDPAADQAMELRVPDAWLRKLGPVGPPAIPLVTITRAYGHSATGGPLLARPGGARFLSPEEILRLHAFPEGFAFPSAMDLRTRRRLAGNSVHVASVRSVAAMLDRR